MRVRLHHHRRRFGRLRARQPLERGPHSQSAAAGSGPARLAPFHPHARRRGQTGQPERRELGLQHRRRTPSPPAHAVVAARQGAGRLQFDQRDVLHPRRLRRLRRLGRAGRDRLALGQRPAVLQKIRRQRPWRRCLPRRRRPAQRVRPALHQPAVTDLHRRQPADRSRPQPRLQRCGAGRGRFLSGHTARRRTLLGGAGLPQSGASAPESHRAHRRGCQPHHLRRPTRQRRHLRDARPGLPPAGGTRDSHQRRRDQLAAVADAVGHRPGRRAAQARHRRCCRPRRRRRQSAGPPRYLHPVPFDRTGDLRPHQRHQNRLRLLPARPPRPGHQQRRRSRRFRALAAGAG